MTENKSYKENRPDFGTTSGNNPPHSCCLLANTSKKSTFTLKSEEANHINRNGFSQKNSFLTRVTAIRMSRLIKISENWKKLQDGVFMCLLAEMFSCIFPCEKENYPCTTKAINIEGLLVSNSMVTTSNSPIVSKYSVTVIVTNNWTTREIFPCYLYLYIHKNTSLYKSKVCEVKANGQALLSVSKIKLTAIKFMAQLRVHFITIRKFNLWNLTILS